jgi:hypothetical protein
MTQTIDAHAAGCQCPVCFRNTPAEPAARWAVPAGTALTPEAATADYARRIHWWVRLFGVVWLTSLALGIVGMLIFAVAASSQDVDSPSFSGTSSYDACIRNPNTTYAECQLLR